ncbi:MAG: DUF3261 domain-containing protein [Treponema sp.]|nr:DUF3261 domain-containing protein [Treponema sp.]
MKHCGSKRNLPGSALLLLCLVSCATEPGLAPPPYSPVYLTDQAQYTLLHPSRLSAPMDGYQRITASYGTREFSVGAWVMANEQEITMALFNSMGAGMGELFFDEGSIALSSDVFSGFIKPEYIVADFQLCFYRFDAVARALADSGLEFRTAAFVDDNNETGEIRVVSDGKSHIIEIVKTKTAVRLTNHLRGYVYTLEGDF